MKTIIVFVESVYTIPDIHKKLTIGFKEYGLLESSSGSSIELINEDKIFFQSRKFICNDILEKSCWLDALGKFDECYVCNEISKEEYKTLCQFLSRKQGIFKLDTSDETWLSLFKSFMTKKKYKS